MIKEYQAKNETMILLLFLSYFGIGNNSIDKNLYENKQQ